MEPKFTLKYEEIDTRTNKLIRGEVFTDTLDGLMRDSNHRSMHTFQMLGQCTSSWYKNRGFKNPGRDWGKWVEIVGNDISNFVNILNEIEEENRNRYIEIGSTGTIIHTLSRYSLVNKCRG